LTAVQEILSHYRKSFPENTDLGGRFLFLQAMTKQPRLREHKVSLLTWQIPQESNTPSAFCGVLDCL